jgi:hypothetical protein
MKYLYIYWMWIDSTNSITIEKFDSCDFTKKQLNILMKNYFHLKMTKIMLKAFVSKFIKMLDESKKNYPKNILKYTQK